MTSTKNIMFPTAQGVCAGHSMLPTVQPGDRVEVRVGERHRPGDVVLFEGSGGDYDVLHRFILKLPFVPYFVHLGDAPEARVGLARCDRIIGRAQLPRRSPRLRDYCAGLWLAARFAATGALRALT